MVSSNLARPKVKSFEMPEKSENNDDSDNKQGEKDDDGKGGFASRLKKLLSDE